ncbi:photoreceptor cilium actin regulator-like [Heptranchias perlo]|uniref:photoreceptor cilium actin regulator-like n=1 Tax=Heptranchias perlo TaxID=212740 RepID=UPI00355AC208
MGCAPSQREIIQHLAKNTLRPLKKAKALASPDNTPTESLNHSISEGSGISDSESNLSEDVRENISRPGSKGERWRAGRGRCQDPPLSTVPGRLPELYNEEMKREKLAAGAKVAVSEVIASQKYVPRNMPVQKPHTYTDWHGNAAQQPKRTRKQKGRHAAKQTKSAKLRARSHSRGEDEEKVDFPALLVKAHQAAYAYLNPSLSKYDAVLSLTDQAAETQLILQQMVSFLALRFEEVNRILEEIATEGERLVEDVGPHLAWSVEKGAPEEQPDLLQQLLQYTVNKMQATNGKVTSLTATALQEACGYLQSAADTFQKRLAVKQEVDKRLQRLIIQLEACALQQPHTKPGDTALYSEDSGIGADTDSMKEYCNPDKCGRRVSCDSRAYHLCRDSLPHSSHRHANLSHAMVCTSKTHDCALEHQFKDIFYSPLEEKASSAHPSESVNASKSSLMKARTSLDSFESATSVECEALLRTDSMDFCSLDEEDDEESESETTADGMHRRPRSSPPETEAVRPAPRRIDNPENEEMTIKIKDAISGKIQFVPVTPGSNVWSDEDSKSYPVRPSTANGCKTQVAKQRRSRSAESLKSKAEDPTLLELQRTQKDLSRRLEKMFQAKEVNQGPAERQTMAKPKITANLPSAEQTAPTNKLKASLNKNFSILPSQEKVLVKRNDLGKGRQVEDRRGKTGPAKVTPLKRDSAKVKENEAPKPCAGKPGVRPQRKSVRGLIDTFSRGSGGAKPGDPTRPLAAPEGTVRFDAPTLPSVPSSPPQVRPSRTAQEASGEPASAEATTFLPPVPADEGAAESGLDAEDFPSPPSALELPPGGLTAVAGTRRAGAGAGAGTCWEEGACAAERAPTAISAVSKATVTQRLLASLDSVALLPSKHTGIGTGTGAARRFPRPAEREAEGRLSNSGSPKSQKRVPIAESQCRLKAAAAAGQHWQPYKIINLRYAGESCSSPESGSAQFEPPADHQPDNGRPAAASPPAASQVRNAGDSSPRGESAGENGSATPLAKVTPLERQCQRPVTSALSSPAVVRKTPPTKFTAHSPPTDRKLDSPSSQPGHLFQASRCPAPSPPAEKRFPSPPLQPKHLFRPTGHADPLPSEPSRCSNPLWEPRHLSQALANRQPSPPSLRKQLSPPASPKRLSPPPLPRKLPSPPLPRKLPSPPLPRKLPSPPLPRKLPSPPTQRKLPSPPSQRKQASPPTHRKLPSPPTGRREASPPPNSNGASPPISPGVVRKGSSNHFETGPESQSPTNVGSNALSVFCPSSDSMFEAKPPSPPTCFGTANAAGQSHSIILGDGSPMISRVAWRNSFVLRQPGDQQRRLTLSGVHPQPFVKKSFFPDCKTRAQFRLPVSGSAGSEPTLHSIGLDGNSENEGDPRKRHYISDLRGASRSVSHPELCVVGQGLQ